ncbi:MAG: redoxin domain-containing protein [Bacteroidetes bacterium]|nr:redoxin domain-containing protein [Bacteroidota bacterium]
MRVILIFCFACLANLAVAQTGYKINFKVNGWKDTIVYLGHYYSDQTYLKDTAYVNDNGEFFFDNKNTLPQGVYFLVKKTKSGNTKIFDFMVGKYQFFTLETSKPDFIENMKVIGDEDNKLYFDNVAYNIERNKEVAPLTKILKDSTLQEDLKKESRDAFAKINDKVMEHQRELIAKYPTTMTARLLKASMPVKIPDPPKKANGNIDSTFQLRYYREHFFDNLDLSDDALIRLPQPLYKEKLKEYLEKLFIPQPDSITNAINHIVQKAKPNRETYKYLIWNCMSMYQLPEIMGLDEVFVNLYDQYFKSGEMDFWVNAKIKENLKEYADKIRSSMIGRPGANLIMQDANLQPKSMYDIKAKYTVLFIFRPDCGHCREETPKLIDFYTKNKSKFNLEVFAVSTDTSMKKMRDFIKEFKTPWITVDGPRSYINTHFMKLYHADTTPTIYILDDKKKIIAKKLPVRQLEDFLTKHEKMVQIKAGKKVAGSEKAQGK